MSTYNEDYFELLLLYKQYGFPLNEVEEEYFWKYYNRYYEG